MNQATEIQVGDIVTFEWTDGTEKTGVVESLWANVPDGTPCAGVSVVEETWENGRTYDIALEWVTNHVHDFTGDGLTMNHEATQAVMSSLTIDGLADTLTYGGKLRASKSDKLSLLEQYLWRMCRFQFGFDTSMPVTASWWLQQYLDKNGLDAKVSGIMDDAGKELTAALAAVVTELAFEMGHDPARAAKVWKKAGAF